MNDTMPASDVSAEMGVLACLLQDPSCRDEVSRVIAPSDFYRPQHGELFTVMLDLEAYDPTRVMSECQKRSINHDLLPRLVDYPAIPTQVRVHAESIRDCAVRRSLSQAAVRLAQRVDSLDADLGELLSGHQLEVEQAADRLTRGVVTPSLAVEDFLLGADVYDWVLPGLMERGDRMILTGAEGAGKSTFLQQVAVCAAAGVHPFTHTDLPPVRVLLIDLENGRMHLRRKLRPLVELAAKLGHPLEGRLRVEHRPAGVDLGRLEDAGWLVGKVEASAPDLIVAGPLYRMHTTALDKEDAARQITVVLDRVAQRARAALVLEAHAPHGIGGQRWWRPAGSSLFMRWPGFGVGLKPIKGGGVRVLQWRGPRDERAFPQALRRGPEGTWPWLEDLSSEDAA